MLRERNYMSSMYNFFITTTTKESLIIPVKCGYNLPFFSYFSAIFSLYKGIFTIVCVHMYMCTCIMCICACTHQGHQRSLYH